MQPPTNAPNLPDVRASLGAIAQGLTFLNRLLSYGVPDAARRVEEAILAYPSPPRLMVTLVDCDQVALESFVPRQRKKGYGLIRALTAHLEPDEREGREGQQRVVIRCGYEVRYRHGGLAYPDEPAEGMLLGYVSDDDQPWVEGLLTRRRGFKGGFHGFILHRLMGRRLSKKAVVMVNGPTPTRSASTRPADST